LYSISAEELAISEKLGSSVAYLKRLNFLDAQADGPHLVIELRRFLKTSNLEQIPNIVQLGTFRLPQPSSVDPYVLCAWLRMSELITAKQPVASTLDIPKLRDKISTLRGLLFKESSEIALTLTRELSECGIAFSIVRHFEGVPVQGIIQRRTDNTLRVVMTDTYTFADLFWSVFFYEIGRIMNGDITDRLIGYEPVDKSTERNADPYAPTLLIDNTRYTEFVLDNDFSLSRIRQFSEILSLPSFIVIGRLQRDGYLAYSDYVGERKQYYFGSSNRTTS
jgi:HTH-type transcriptional regulator/antitoxin HigA